MFMLLAHEEADKTEEAVNLLSKVLHEPTWVGLLLVSVLIIGIYFLTRYLKWSLPTRLFCIVASTIFISALYLPHNPQVTGIVLSAGFIATFLLTFTLLARVKDQ